MNGYGLAAVVVVCVTVAFVATLWAVVRAAARTDGSVSTGREELSAEGEFDAVQAGNGAGRPALREQIAAAVERARREQGGGL